MVPCLKPYVCKMYLASICECLHPYILNKKNCSISGKNFSIERGVKQGDVISPLFFNAGLEHALRKWKFRVRQCGWDVGTNECLTNVRYADDLIIHAKSEAELVLMLETLIQELSLVGLNLNSTKTKILSTENSQCSNFVEVKGDMVEILHGTDQHKYLGKKNVRRFEDKGCH